MTRTAPVVLAVLVTAMAIWLALRGALVATQPIESAGRIWPVGSTTLSMQAIARIVAAGGVVDQPARALGAQALARGPVEALPLLVAGLDASASGDLGRAMRLMQAARQRDPRLPMARVWLLNDHARAGRYADALAEAGPVMRLLPGSRDQVFAMIARIAAQPGGGRVVQQALDGHPDWGEPYGQWMAEHPLADHSLPDRHP